MNEFVEEISKSNLIQSLEVELHLMDISHYAKLLEDTFKEIGVSSGVLKYENIIVPVGLPLNHPDQQTAGLIIHVKTRSVK